jgi:uncharacterized protein YrrD
MLHDVKKLEGYAVGATDGELGTAKDVYFDDNRWAIRYLVVETGSWLRGREVLISPSSVRSVAPDNGLIHLTLSQQQVKESPGIDTNKPVSRQHEIAFYKYYGYPYYWDGAFLWGPVMYPRVPAEPSRDSASGSSARYDAQAADEGEARIEGENPPGDSHLRSSNDVIGHEALASDGPIGSVHSFVFDDESWAIRYLVVNTGNWLPGKRVLLSPHRIQSISWTEREVYLDMTREEVKASLRYTDHILHTHDGTPVSAT